jgi:hypothetical protein
VWRVWNSQSPKSGRKLRPLINERYVSTDRGLWVKELLEKASVEELKILKAKFLKWMNVVDLSWMRGIRSITLGTKYSVGKKRVEALKP